MRTYSGKKTRDSLLLALHTYISIPATSWWCKGAVFEHSPCATAPGEPCDRNLLAATPTIPGLPNPWCPLLPKPAGVFGATFGVSGATELSCVEVPPKAANGYPLGLDPLVGVWLDRGLGGDGAAGQCCSPKIGKYRKTRFLFVITITNSMFYQNHEIIP